ncbi:MAG: malate dehydrogenase [Planctomycetota bacterium]
MRLAKISVLGAGNVGGSTAAAIATRRLGEVFLYDAVDGLAEGKAMDISHAAAHFHSISPIRGCEDLDELDGTDVFVISAGSPRKAGMTRADLLESNLQVLRELCNALLPASPDATVLIITNPVDVLTAHVAREWPERTILGLGCSLDTVRLQYFLAAEAEVAVDCVDALVIGTHNNQMVPLVGHARIGGAAASTVLSPEQIQRACDHTRSAGADIVARLKTRGSFYAASYCACEIVEAIVRDTRDVFPLSVPCRGAYGYDDVTLALPCAVGHAGAERVIEIQITAEERTALDACAETVRAALDS